MSDELKPRNRTEQYYEYMATGENAAELTPRSRQEQWFEKIAEGRISDYAELENTPIQPASESEVDGNYYYSEGSITRRIDGEDYELATIKDVDDALISVYRYKGSVATYSDLPSEDLTIGDVYNVVSDGNNYAWDGNDWDQLGGFKTNYPFPSSWQTSLTTDDFCADVNADGEAIEGMTYLGDVYFTDMPFSGNGDLVVEIIEGTGTSNKVIHLILTSGNVAPYRWEYTYWNNGSSTSGWKSWSTGVEVITISNWIDQVTEEQYNKLATGNAILHFKNNSYDDYYHLAYNTNQALFFYSGHIGSSFGTINIDRTQNYKTFYNGTSMYVQGTSIQATNNDKGKTLISNGKYSSKWEFGPVLNQDLDDANFTPTSSTYYKHIGASAATYEIGKIYYYDGTNYHVIDGSDGSATIATIDSSNIVTIKAGIAQSGGAIANDSGSDITLAKVASTGAYSDLVGAPTDVSAFNNDAGYITSLPSGSAVIASDSSDIITIKAGLVEIDGVITNSSDSDITLAKVAKTGNYADLSGSPTNVVNSFVGLDGAVTSDNLVSRNDKVAVDSIACYNSVGGSSFTNKKIVILTSTPSTFDSNYIYIITE